MKGQSWVITFLLISIIVVGWGFYFVVFNTEFWLVGFWLILLEIILFYTLLRRINRNKRLLNSFMESINQDDFQTSYSLTRPDNLDREFANYFEEINKKFVQIRRDNESNHFFLQTIVEHIKIPILVYDQTEKILLFNEALVELFDIPVFHSLQSLERVSPEIPGILRNINSNSQVLESVYFKDQWYRLSMQAVEVKIDQGFQKVVTIQDIRKELEAQEVEAYQKLIRVLTHEIMNSAIPITTLTEVLNNMVAENNLKDFSDEDIEDLEKGLDTIKNRSKALVKFVNSYKSLTKVPELEFQKVRLSVLLAEIISLMRPLFRERGLSLEDQIILDNEVVMDKEQIAQVLINLIKNGLEVIPDDGVVSVIAMENQGKPTIVVRDNGSGIKKEDLANIFIPFFTTKESGSGVGLSISRNIMKLHGGSITVNSIPGNTEFIVEFPS